MANGLLRSNENLGYVYDPAGNLFLRTNNTLVQMFTSDGANELASITRNPAAFFCLGGVALRNRVHASLAPVRDVEGSLIPALSPLKPCICSLPAGVSLAAISPTLTKIALFPTVFAKPAAQIKN